ncbi:metalloregulator ArsR/SmtB family transcription factor [Skermanella sp. TT6]|uniref:Metalloregulator ArsR/SmtB family transcription factor n=2 Tax=Skermanella cutis TaxID=2775420 RepID=A0ABX7BE25_9PROT|nr:metalloregulator ArsR/SmtB family transcription factor [Skermanella sp. TT6]QQP91291.1 metalloregulator ArsR/SmtB family transcription factor [Skermanella sp. TT6]
MDTKHAIASLSALAQETRLDVYRLLIRAGGEGMPAGEIARTLGVPPNTLSSHLALMANAGLVTSSRVGRSIIYNANYDGMRDLLVFLTEDCCQGNPEVCSPSLQALAAAACPPDRYGARPVLAESAAWSAPMSERPSLESPYNVLFLCTGNSARSIMAECAMTRWGQGRFNAYSAGSQPRGAVHPKAIELLKRLNYKTDHLRSKSWDEFAAPGAPELDFVFTVCDSAASEPCPAWPGQPMSAHWGVEDPAAFVGSDERIRKVFKRSYLELECRIKIFTSLRLEALDKLSLRNRLAEIGRIRLSEDEVAAAG